jgi:hypothetical protein
MYSPLSIRKNGTRITVFCLIKAILCNVCKLLDQSLYINPPKDDRFFFEFCTHEYLMLQILTHPQPFQAKGMMIFALYLRILILCLLGSLYLDEQILIFASQSKLENRHDDVCVVFCKKYLLHAYQNLLMSLYLDEQIFIFESQAIWNTDMTTFLYVLYEIFTTDEQILLLAS